MAQESSNVQPLDPFNRTFGLPPSTWISDEVIFNSMPVLEITPCRPEFKSGLNLFSVVDDSVTYLEILGKHGYSTEMPIRCAFLADNFPTDSFTNDYGETFLQKFTDVASQGMSQLAQMTGATTGTEALENIGKFTSDVGKEKGGLMGKMLQAGGAGAEKMGVELRDLARSMEAKGGAGGIIGGGAQLIDKMIAGHRVDFPQVWRNSGFTPSYTATIRLYNPNPGDPKSTDKYIAGPLAMLLCLAVPRSTDGKTYNWPFFHKIKSVGIYNLDPAVITNITVVKGGDQQQIAYNQSLAMVDVRIDFGSLYNSMLVDEGDTQRTNRPTVKTYIDSLKETDDSLFTRRSEVNQVAGQKAGVAGLLHTRVGQLSREDQIKLVKNEAAKQRQAPTVAEVVADNRVSAGDAIKELQLLAQGDEDFYPTDEETE